MARRRKRIRIKIVKPFQFYSLVVFLLGVIVLIVFGAVKLIGAVTGGEPDSDIKEAVSEKAEPSDITPPVIECELNRETYVGEAVSYKKGVTVTDDTDQNPVISVDSSGVNIRTPGVYTYTVTATDSSGNSASRTVTLKVKEKPEGYVTEEEMYAKADDVIDKIITDGMTKRQQVEAVYKWARANVRYVSHSDKSDWVQTAYTTFVNRQSDCFGFFAVTKALLNRLGIENMDVVKVKLKPSASNHYWNLVTVDGSNWYHLDTTPRKGSGDDFCMVTDEFLLNYSKNHDNSHNFDRSLYPATPKE